MMGALIAWGVGIIAIVGLALILPCEGCRLRRERMKRAYAQWHKAPPAQNEAAKTLLRKSEE